MTHPLLTPRYMVEADYPNSPYEVGTVITSTSTHYDKYPKVFRKMHWSEGRSLGEMPRYLQKWKEVVKVIRYRHVVGKWWFLPEWAKKVGYEFIVTSHTPATEAEYLEYLKSKEK